MSFINNTELLFSNFLKTAENIITHCDDNKEERTQMLESLREIVEKSCIHDTKIRKITDTVKELSNNVDDSTDADQILKEFNESKKELLEYKPNIAENTNYSMYCRQIKEIMHNVDREKCSEINDDDIEMTQDDINVIDPFTKKRMSDPVKNTICGHVYDRESINAMVKMSKSIRCPVVGCINKHPIIDKNLVPDIVTRKYIRDNPI